MRKTKPFSHRRFIVAITSSRTETHYSFSSASSLRFLFDSCAQNANVAALALINTLKLKKSNSFVGLATEKIFDRDFFPSMGNLIRQDMPDISHHNCVCTGTCCRTDFFPSMGPEPSPMATFDVVISHPTLHGWEEQAHKTCAGCGSAKLCAAGIRRTHDTAGVCAAGEFGRPHVPAGKIVWGSERRKRWRVCDRAGCNRLLLQMVSGGWEDQLSRRFAGFVWLNSEHSKDWEPTFASHHAAPC